MVKSRLYRQLMQESRIDKTNDKIFICCILINEIRKGTYFINLNVAASGLPAAASNSIAKQSCSPFLSKHFSFDTFLMGSFFTLARETFRQIAACSVALNQTVSPRALSLAF